MIEIWTSIYDWAMKVGFGLAWAKVTASCICAISVILIDFILCIIFIKLAKRFITKLTKSPSHHEKYSLLIRVSIWFIFSWILYSHFPDTLQALPFLIEPASRILNVISVILCAATLSTAITCIQSTTKSSSKQQMLTTKTLWQMLKILIWFTTAIIVVSALMGKSPTFVLSGLGALTAVLMLIFRDSLLGLVAGIQVSQNDMIRLGDWITMPKHNADGNVIDIALTTMKIQNFDNTVTMIPSSAFISDSFINWRYMSTSKGRRIKRPVWISATSIRELTEEQLKNLVKQGLLKEEDRPVSNLAAFETWLRRMLKSDENITQELTCMVRQTDAGDTGIPVEVYAFTKTRNWEEYEMIQTDIFDKIFVTVPKFGLQVYQRTGDKIN